MKRFLLLIVVFFSIQFASAQDIAQVSNEDDKIYENYEKFDTRPDFPGGKRGFYNYIIKNFKMPAVEVGGKVMVSFVIEKDGSLTDIQVIQDVGDESAKEAVRVMKECPSWKPGIQNGKPVRCKYVLPITVSSSK